MKQIMSKSSLAIILSGLKGFKEPKVMQEQYVMDSEICASALWNASFLGDIKEKEIADLGCGTGIIGIGALLLGAKHVIFVDSDKSALETAKNNVSKVKSEGYRIKNVNFICRDIEKIDSTADVVLQNPPFGTKVKHKDALFLEKALKIAPVVYSFHKSETKAFLDNLAIKNDAKVTHIWDYHLPLKSTFDFHSRKMYRINVSCLRFEKNKGF